MEAGSLAFTVSVLAWDVKQVTLLWGFGFQMWEKVTVSCPLLLLGLTFLC